MSLIIKARGLAAILVCTTATFSLAQKPPASGAKESEQAIMKLPYRDATPLYGGKVLFVNGTASPGMVDRFSLEGLAVTQPVVVSVMPQDMASELTLEAGKLSQKQIARATSSEKRGVASISFRAQGESLINVKSSGKASPYQLMVWVGPEIRQPMKSPFKKSNAEAMKAGSKPSATRQGEKK